MAKKYQLTQDGPEVQALLNKVEGLKANQTPGAGETPTALETLSLDGVLYSVVTKAVSDLVNYYTKSETYTKAEVNTMVAAINQFTIQPVDALPQPPSADTMNILYLVPAEEPKVANEKDEFITVIKDGSYAWEQVGSTAIDLSGYVTTEALNTALADYVTSNALAEAIAGLHDVKYTPQTLTDAQKSQARTNIGATAPEIFWAEYGVTTAQEIENAILANKLIALVYQGRVYPYTSKTTQGAYTFDLVESARIYRIVLSAGGNWSNTYFNVEITSNKSQSIPTDRESENKYPSVKAVFDSLGKWGVVSQTQTWTGNNNTGYDYTMSNQVFGLIPQTSIDLFEDVGAIFNDTGADIVRQDPFGYDVTHKMGCFYLPGIGDISYKEMITIYECRWSVPQVPIGSVPATRVFEATRARCGLVTYGHNWNTSINLYMLAPYNSSSPLSVLCLSNRNEVYVGSARQMLLSVPTIKAIYPVLNLQNLTGTGSAHNTFYGAFGTCSSLKEVRFKNLKIDVPFNSCARISLASIAYMVDNAANTTAITITLHATAYARCQADTTEYTYNSQTYVGILAYASAKNITIASNG